MSTNNLCFIILSSDIILHANMDWINTLIACYIDNIPFPKHM